MHCPTLRTRSTYDDSFVLPSRAGETREDVFGRFAVERPSRAFEGYLSRLCVMAKVRSACPQARTRTTQGSNNICICYYLQHILLCKNRHTPRSVTSPSTAARLAAAGARPALSFPDARQRIDNQERLSIATLDGRETCAAPVATLADQDRTICRHQTDTERPQRSTPLVAFATIFVASIRLAD